MSKNPLPKGSFFQEFSWTERELRLIEILNLPVESCMQDAYSIENLQQESELLKGTFTDFVDLKSAMEKYPSNLTAWAVYHCSECPGGMFAATISSQLMWNKQKRLIDQGFLSLINYYAGTSYAKSI